MLRNLSGVRTRQDGKSCIRQEEPEQCMAVIEGAGRWGNPKDMDRWSTVWASGETRDGPTRVG